MAEDEIGKYKVILEAKLAWTSNPCPTIIFRYGGRLIHLADCLGLWWHLPGTELCDDESVVNVIIKANDNELVIRKGKLGGEA